MSSKSALTAEQIRRRVRELGEWFHNLDLRGTPTAPHHFLGDYPGLKWRQFAHALPADLRGRTVLDIGCNAGFYSIEMKRRGADRVVGIDSDETYLAQARFAAEVFEVDIDFRRPSVYDVAQLGQRSSWASSTTSATRCSRSICCTSTSWATCWCSSRCCAAAGGWSGSSPTIRSPRRRCSSGPASP
jgi:SAM-dependent methyltransferase